MRRFSIVVEHRQPIVYLLLHRTEVRSHIVKPLLQFGQQLLGVLIRAFARYLRVGFGLLLNLLRAFLRGAGNGFLFGQARGLFLRQHDYAVRFFFCLGLNAVLVLRDPARLPNLLRDRNAHLVENIQTFVFINQPFGAEGDRDSFVDCGF